MKIFPSYSKRSQLKIGVVVGILVIASSIGGFIWFKSTDDWAQIESLILTSPVVANHVGKANDVSISYFGFSYKTGGSWAKADFNADISGSIKTASFHVIAERKNWKWGLVEISKQ